MKIFCKVVVQKMYMLQQFANFKTDFKETCEILVMLQTLKL